MQRLRERLLAEGALKLTALQPKAARNVLVARLLAEGFEASTSWLRRPLPEQLRQALVHGATLTKKSLAGLVRGATAAELARALVEAEQRGEARRVLRGKLEVFTAGDTPALTPRQLSALRTLLSSLEKALATAVRKQGLSLLASDVAQTLLDAQRLLRGPQANPTMTQGTLDPSTGAELDPLLAALDATRDERTGMSFVPKVVARLLPSMSVAGAQDVLLSAARRELTELRPEGGLGRLTPEELQLCPPGPGGTRLSWARRLEGVTP